MFSVSFAYPFLECYLKPQDHQKLNCLPIQNYSVLDQISLRDHLIHRSSLPFRLESNPDASKIGSEGPVDSMGPDYLLLNLNSAP